jgi:hypothetical protein
LLRRRGWTITIAVAIPGKFPLPFGLGHLRGKIFLFVEFVPSVHGI